MKKKTLFGLCGILCVSLLIGCASTKSSSDRPGWADKGSGYFTGEYGKAFYGVGIASNITNISLRRSASDAQARTDLARIFSTRIEDLVKNYAKSVSAGPEGQVIEEQLVQQSTRAFTELDLSGAMIVDRYFDTAENAQYSLARLDLEMFKSQVAKLQNLSQEIKKAIEDNAEQAFNELDERVEKK